MLCLSSGYKASRNIRDNVVFLGGRKMLNDTYKLLASVTVVRGLYDSQKGIYDVLCEFISDIIAKEHLYSFRASDLTEKLNNYYSFQLNESVIKTCLKRMKFGRKNGAYSCNGLTEKTVDINSAISKSQKENDELFYQLFEFLKQRLGHDLTKREEDRYKTAFCDFLLQDELENNDKINQYFHEFILSIATNDAQMETLNQIKEGILLYEGIRYSSNLSEMGSWKSKLVLFLDTEILFAIGGYNSMMYQDQYTELNKYIQEINRGCTSANKKIKLAYFPENKKEIDLYFESAERIVRGQDFLDPTKEAMSQIVNTCTSPSDVQSKKTLFYQSLKRADVRLCEKDFYNSDLDNTEYNLEAFDTWGKYVDIMHESRENIHKSIACLSHINILRKGINNQGFENCSYIFLTATGRTLKLASMPEFLENGNVPLATTFDFLINHFWFKLNKGFGTNRTPRTLDMVIRARHILASIINTKAAQKYDEFKSQYERNEISKEDFYALNTDLRNHLKKPEEVDVDTISTEIEDIEKWNFDVAMENQHRKEIELENANIQISDLKNEIKEYRSMQTKINDELKQAKLDWEAERKELKNEKQKVQKELELAKEKNRSWEEDLLVIKKELKEERDEKKAFQLRKQKRKYRIICFVVIFMLILGVVGFCYGIIAEQIWAQVISAILELSGIITFTTGKLKRYKPENI